MSFAYRLILPTDKCIFPLHLSHPTCPGDAVPSCSKKQLDDGNNLCILHPPACGHPTCSGSLLLRSVHCRTLVRLCDCLSMQMGAQIQ